MHKHMKQIIISIVAVLLLLIIVLFFIPNTGITSLVTGHSTAMIIPQLHPLFDEDKVIMRVSNPVCGGFGCNVDTWGSTAFLNVILNTNPVRPSDSTYNPHVCSGQNQIGYVVDTPVSEFYSYDSANPPPVGPPTPLDVCYSEFECEICNTRTSPTCATLTTEGYDCYFSVMSLNGDGLLEGKVRPCGTTPGYDYMCRDCAVKCPTYIQDQDSVFQPFTACVDDGSHMCCADYANSCMYGNACYTEGDTIMMGVDQMACTNQHWCPIGDGYSFTYDPTSDACVPDLLACYSLTNPAYCNVDYPGMGNPTSPYWTDTSDTPCIGTPAADPTIADSKACCDVAVSSVIYYFYQDNVETESGGLLQSVNICGDTYNVDTASDGMCLSAPPYDDSCTPGYFNDPDCCGQCGWVCDDVSELCGDDLNEYWQDELDSMGNTITTSTETVLDSINQGACVSDLTNCADDYDEYFDYSGSGPCTVGVNCRNVDNANADFEVCDAGVWHDPDESAVYCDAVNIFDYNVYWTTTDEGGYDDYDNDKTNGYCYGDDGFTIYGEVTDGNDPIEGASFAFQDVGNNAMVSEGLSLGDGTFQANVFADYYNIVVEKDGYIPYTEANYELLASQPMDFVLALSSECQPDCTTNDDYCHAECDGVNGCSFPSSFNTNSESVADVCNGKGVGWPVDFDVAPELEVVCCTGPPATPSTPVVADPSTGDVEVFTSTRIVNVGGRLLTMHIVVTG
jgi:hypothetical protein